MKMKRGARAAAIAVAGLLVLWASAAAATVVIYMDLATLVERSDVIVRVQVEEQRSYLDREQGRVVTDTTLAVEERFFGASPAKVVVQQWGGELADGRREQIAGDARFEPGEEAIVFLKRDRDGRKLFYLTALSQAKFRISQEGGRRYVQRDLSDLAFMLSDGKKVVEIDEVARPVVSFEAELRATVAAVKEIDPAELQKEIERDEKTASGGK